MRRVTIWSFVLGCVLAGGALAAPIHVEVDGDKTYPISPYIYGINGADWKTDGPVTLTRIGGNRLTAYNWETNASNAGSDWNHQNDNYLGDSDVPGEFVRQIVADAQAAHAATLVTVPTLGYVAADKKGDGDVNKTPDYLNTRFLVSKPTKGAPFADPPDTKDRFVYQDEFVHWLETAFPAARKDPATTLFYDLDNEPDLWSSTHARIHPKPVTYDELVANNATYASAIKAVVPDAQVFGFVSYGWNGFTTLQNAPDANGRNFIDCYLDGMKKAETAAGKRLVDVLDLHWYPEAQGGGQRIVGDDASPARVAARLQAPRSLWDPTYKEDSWITQWSTNGPINLIPRVQQQIADHYPGTRLAFSEYDYGGGKDISGALAEADVLGIFGREGLFEASLWGGGPYQHGAFALYRNYDGKGAAFGPTGLLVTGGDKEKLSVYASRTADGRTVLVAINKTADALPLDLQIKGLKLGADARIFQLTAGSPQLKAAGTVPVDANGKFAVTLPAYSASTLEVVP
jgi:hypothetical protein